MCQLDDVGGKARRRGTPGLRTTLARSLAQGAGGMVGQHDCGDQLGNVKEVMRAWRSRGVDSDTLSFYGGLSAVCRYGVAQEGGRA